MGDSTTILCNKSCEKVQCDCCKRHFKNERGHKIHIGRSKNCKKFYLDNKTIKENNSNMSLPKQILNTVKCPSTTFESLQNLCKKNKRCKIKKHGAKKCKMCPKLILLDEFVSSSTHRIYKSIIPECEKIINCKSSNLIYLITCSKCGLQYVGETCQKICRRFYTHDRYFKKLSKDNKCKILSRHFNQGPCQGAEYTIHIIEKLEGDGRDENNKIDKGIASLRRRKETEWMLKLQTVYPFGLNDRIGDEYMTDREENIVSLRFPPLKRIKKHTVRVRTKNNTKNDFITKNFIYIIMESIREDRKNSMNLIRVLLSSLRKAQVKKIGETIQDFLEEKSENFQFIQYFLAALDIIYGKLFSEKSTNNKSMGKTIPKFRIKIKFLSKGIDFLNLNKILKDGNKLLPDVFQDDPPMIVYILENPIKSTIFNHKKAVQNIDIASFLNDPTTVPCNCADSPFVDENHGHIVTGDLNIVKNRKLKELLQKGPKYREPENINWENITASLSLSLDDSIKAWGEKEGLAKDYFIPWKANIMEKVREKITHVQTNFVNNTNQKILRDNVVLNELKNLQNQFVIAPIDKADNNAAFICKRFYIETIVKELGLETENDSATYEKIDENTEQIVQKHMNELKLDFSVTVEENMKKLPEIYWLPKLHKNPIKPRFIIAGKECSMKKICKEVTEIFKLASKQVENYSKKARQCSGINQYWVINNSKPVLDVLTHTTRKKNAKTISSFDFSTLYTKIPHDKLLIQLTNIIKFIFKGGDRKYISVTKNGANWVKCGRKSSVLYDINKTLNAVKYILDNCYFKFGDLVFRQIIGIPMGIDPAPYFANLFLYMYESSWIKKIKKEDPILARKFGNTFRFIDDLTSINDGNEFEAHHKEIYPEELELKKENALNTETNFLELNIKIQDRIFLHKIFDKRDNFGFHINRLPFKSSNIPSKMFYATINAEILRICRASSLLEFAISIVCIP